MSLGTLDRALNKADSVLYNGALTMCVYDSEEIIQEYVQATGSNTNYKIKESRINELWMQRGETRSLSD